MGLFIHRLFANAKCSMAVFCAVTCLTVSPFLHAQNATKNDSTKLSEEGPLGSNSNKVIENSENILIRMHLEKEKGPKEPFFVGDAVNIEIEVTAISKQEVSATKQKFPGFEILDRSVKQTIQNDKKIFTFKLTLLALEPGEKTISPIKFRALSEDGDLSFVETAPLEITIQSHLANEPNAKPKPWSSPVEVMEDDYTLLWILGTLTSILLIIFLTLFIRAWWSRRPQNNVLPPPRPPWETAIEQLGILRKDGPKMIEQGQTVEWIDQLSDVLRQYLGGRFGFEGLESTTDEVAEKLQHVELQGITHSEVTSILAECDLVKFAKATIDIHQCVRMLDGVEGIVRRSIPTLPSNAPLDESTSQSSPSNSQEVHSSHSSQGSISNSLDENTPEPLDEDQKWQGGGSHD